MWTRRACTSGAGGTISYIQLDMPQPEVLCIVNVHKLSKATFTTCNTARDPLRSALEGPIGKVLYAVRGDHGALLKLYDGRSVNIHDLH